MARYFGGFRDRLKKRSKHLPITIKDVEWVKVATTFSWSPARREYQWLEPEDYLSSFLSSHDQVFDDYNNANGQQEAEIDFQDELAGEIPGDGSLGAAEDMPFSSNAYDGSDTLIGMPAVPDEEEEGIAYVPPYDFVPETPSYSEEHILRPDIDVPAELPLLDEYKLEIVSALQRRGIKVEAKEIKLPSELAAELNGYHSGRVSIDTYDLRARLQKYKRQVIESYEKFYSVSGPIKADIDSSIIEVDTQDVEQKGIPQEQGEDYESFILSSLNRLEATMNDVELAADAATDKPTDLQGNDLPGLIDDQESDADLRGDIRTSRHFSTPKDTSDILSEGLIGVEGDDDLPSSFADDSWLVLPVDSRKAGKDLEFPDDPGTPPAEQTNEAPLPEIISDDALQNELLNIEPLPANSQQEEVPPTHELHDLSQQDLGPQNLPLQDLSSQDLSSQVTPEQGSPERDIEDALSHDELSMLSSESLLMKGNRADSSELLKALNTINSRFPTASFDADEEDLSVESLADDLRDLPLEDDEPLSADQLTSEPVESEQKGQVNSHWQSNDEEAAGLDASVPEEDGLSLSDMLLQLRHEGDSDKLETSEQSTRLEGLTSVEDVVEAPETSAPVAPEATVAPETLVPPTHAQDIQQVVATEAEQPKRSTQPAVSTPDSVVKSDPVEPVQPLSALPEVVKPALSQPELVQPERTQSEISQPELPEVASEQPLSNTSETTSDSSQDPVPYKPQSIDEAESFRAETAEEQRARFIEEERRKLYSLIGEMEDLEEENEVAPADPPQPIENTVPAPVEEKSTSASQPGVDVGTEEPSVAPLPTGAGDKIQPENQPIEPAESTLVRDFAPAQEDEKQPAESPRLEALAELIEGLEDNLGTQDMELTATPGLAPIVEETSVSQDEAVVATASDEPVMTQPSEAFLKQERVEQAVPVPNVEEPVVHDSNDLDAIEPVTTEPIASELVTTDSVTLEPVTPESTVNEPIIVEPVESAPEMPVSAALDPEVTEVASDLEANTVSRINLIDPEPGSTDLNDKVNKAVEAVNESLVQKESELESKAADLVIPDEEGMFFGSIDTTESEGNSDTPLEMPDDGEYVNREESLHSEPAGSLSVSDPVFSPGAATAESKSQSVASKEYTVMAEPQTTDKETADAAEAPETSSVVEASAAPENGAGVVETVAVTTKEADAKAEKPAEEKKDDKGLVEADEEIAQDVSLASVVESLAFATEDPIPLKRVARIYSEILATKMPTEKKVRAAVETLNQQYEASGRTYRIKEWAGGIRMASHPQYARFIRALYKDNRPKKLSRTLMETLAIIAYSQPSTKPEVDFVRGVDSDYAVRKLLELGLIDIVGRSESIGRPLLYGTSERFLEQFGLSGIEALPKLREVEDLLGDPAFKKERLQLLALEEMESATERVEDGDASEEHGAEFPTTDDAAPASPEIASPDQSVEGTSTPDPAA